MKMDEQGACFQSLLHQAPTERPNFHGNHIEHVLLFRSLKRPPYDFISRVSRTIAISR